MNKDQLELGIIIPSEQLSPEALDGLVEEFILREGTDYGKTIYSTEQKKEHVYKKIKSKYVLVVYDSTAETCSLISKDHPGLRKL